MASYYPPEMLTLDDSMAVDSDPEVDELASDAGGVDDAVSVQEDTGPSIRAAGSSLLPMLRIENIIQADGMSPCSPRLDHCLMTAGVAGNLTMSKEALFVVSVATVCQSPIMTTFSSLDFYRKNSSRGWLKVAWNKQNPTTDTTSTTTIWVCSIPLLPLSTR